MLLYIGRLAWEKGSDALLASEIVIGSVAPSFADEWVDSLKRRGFYIGGLFDSAAAE